MSEPETKNVGRDALGIALFGLAIFAAISVVMSLLEPVENPDGTTAAVHLLVGLIGALPGLLLSAGLAWIGARMWMLARTDDALRHLVGVVGTTLGLSVLVGAASAEAGGVVGALSGGAVSGFMSPLVGIPFGLLCLLIPVWFVWIRPRDLISWNLGQSEDFEAAPSTDSEGVSVAEAEALLPRVPESSPEEQRALQPEPLPEPPISPYPPDVRLQGEIPDGTKPLEPTEPTSAAVLEDRAAGDPRDDVAVSEPLVQGAWTPSKPPGADLVEPEPAPAPDFRTDVDPAPAAALEAQPLAAPEAARPLAESDPAQPLEAGSLPRPSWEQSNLFGEEPVDAYGTPLSILEARGAEHLVVDPPDLPPAAAEGPEVSLAELAAEGASAAPPSQPEVGSAAPGPEEPIAAEAEEEAEEEEYEQASEEEGDEEGEEVYAEDEEDEEEEAEEDEEAEHEEAAEGEGEEEGEEEEEVEEGDEVYAEGEEEEEEEDEEYEEEEEDEEEAEYEEAAEGEGEEEDEEDEDEEEEEEEVEEGDEVYAEDEEEEDEDGEDQDGEDQEEEEEAAELEDEDEDEDEEEPEPEAEPQVEIRPQAAPPAPEPIPAPAGADFLTDELVHQAGTLFIERGRVAVSMLQREYELDFKQATLVLDRLQENGLIGPYMGGQRRDILLTLEEWEQRAGTF